MNYDRITFKVIPENKVVVAEVCNTRFDAVHAFNNKFLEQSSASLYLRVYDDNNKFIMPDKFKAVARCHDEDEFNEEIGKNVALKKLVEKYNKSLNKHLAHILVHTNKALESMDVYFKDKTF